MLEAYVVAGAALLVFGVPTALQQHRYSPIVKNAQPGLTVDRARLGVVVFILLAAIVANVIVNTRYNGVADRFPFLGVAVWIALLLAVPVRKPDWTLLPGALKGSVFLLSLILCASMMPVEKLPVACWVSSCWRRQSDEIFSLVTSIYQRFIDEHEFKQGVPGRLALENYSSQIGRLEGKLDQRFGTFLRVLTSAKSSYTKKYYDALAGSVLQSHLLSYRDAEAWLKSLMQPLEKEVQLRREWLRQREAEIAKAADEGSTFQENTLDLDAEAQRLTRQQNKFDELRARLKKILPEDDNWWARGEAA